MLPDKEQVTGTGNMHSKFGEANIHVVSEHIPTDRQTNRQTIRNVQHYSSLPYLPPTSTMCSVQTLNFLWLMCTFKICF